MLIACTQKRRDKPFVQPTTLLQGESSGPVLRTNDQNFLFPVALGTDDPGSMPNAHQTGQRQRRKQDSKHAEIIRPTGWIMTILFLKVRLSTCFFPLPCFRRVPIILKSADHISPMTISSRGMRGRAPGFSLAKPTVMSATTIVVSGNPNNSATFLGFIC